MENATKAFLIAGSILIVILLIALGIRMMNSTSGVTQQVESSNASLEVSTFNSQFTPYFSNDSTGIKVKSLLTTIISNNVKNPNHIVLVTYYNKSNKEMEAHTANDSNVPALKEILNIIQDDASYKVSMPTECSVYKAHSGYDEHGFIGCIKITKK